MPPSSSVAFIATENPKTWNSGRTASVTSLPATASVSHTRFMYALLTRLAWVSIAPLEMPAVPPVYCSTARSFSGSTGSWRARAGAFSSVRNSTTGASLGSAAVSSARARRDAPSGRRSVARARAGR